MAESLPLIREYEPERAFAWGRGACVTCAQALAQIEHLADRLSAGHPYFNLCSDRYLFTVAFAAVCRAGGVNLLPSNQGESALAEVQGQFPDAATLDDEVLAELGVAFSSEAAATSTPARIATDHCAAIVFTSGSTGTPTGHRKYWGDLDTIVRQWRERFLGGQRPINIAATVPPQHMYGLETSVLPVLQGGCAAHKGVPYLPWEIAGTLAELPAPRALVTTPMHLRGCLSSGAVLPELELAISATAPLSQESAASAELQWRAPVREIYGCTEAGSLASRRVTESEVWTLYDGMRLADEGKPVLSGAHLPEPVPLDDELELIDEQRFRLLGRSQEMIKLGGKRIALGELAERLQAIEGVDDAAVFVPGDAERTDGRERRPAALVVAPALSVGAIRQRLAASVDPVFVPRPVVRVAALPRNRMGKLPRAELEAQLRQHAPDQR